MRAVTGALESIDDFTFKQRVAGLRCSAKTHSPSEGKRRSAHKAQTGRASTPQSGSAERWDVSNDAKTMPALRDALLADVPAIATIHVEAWRVAYQGIVPAEVIDALTVEKRAALWRERIDAATELLLVGFVGEEMAGWISAGAARDADCAGEGEVYALYVAPAHWRSGWGARLMRGVEERLGAAGFRNAFLWVLTENMRARAFYERIGYRLDGATKEEQLCGTRLPHVRYEKRDLG